MFSQKRIVFYCILFVSFFNTAFSQKKTGILPINLNEISGIAFLNDSVLIAHNDSGNEPDLYFLNLKGEIIHTIHIENVKNRDWEDITTDGKGFIYIADTGNNNNDRDNLCIYKINTSGILKKNSISAEKIHFSYFEQEAFPPPKKKMNFDSEALSFFNDQLYLFTKDRTEPTEHKSYCYLIPTKTGTYVLKRDFNLEISDQILGAEIKDNLCYLVSYKCIYLYFVVGEKFQFIKKIKLDPLSKYEAIAVNSKGKIYIADERSKSLGGGFLYRVKF